MEIERSKELLLLKIERRWLYIPNAAIIILAEVNSHLGQDATKQLIRTADLDQPF